MLYTVTGAAGYTGNHIAKILLDSGHQVQSLTGHPGRPNPFGRQIPMHPFNFNQPELLARNLTGTDTLFNTYWVRAPEFGQSHHQCVQDSQTLFEAAQQAGVRRIVHVSITGANTRSDLSYFQGKGRVEQALRELNHVSHTILRPTILYSLDDILLNNMAWTMRKFPVVLMPGNGQYTIQPTHVVDLARLAVSHSQEDDNVTIDAVGPEVFTYRELLETLCDATNSRCRLIPAPHRMVYLSGKILGKIVSDTTLVTREEIEGLTRSLLVSDSTDPAPCPTILSEWLLENAALLGRHYASEQARRR